MHLKRIKGIRKSIRITSAIKGNKEITREFIRKYWRSLLILLVATALILFVFSLFGGRENKNICEMPAGLACHAAEGNSTGIKFVLQNKAEFDMKNLDIYLNSTQEKANVLCESGSNNLKKQEKKIVSCRLANIEPGILKGVVFIKYTNADTKQENFKTGRIEIEI